MLEVWHTQIGSVCLASSDLHKATLFHLSSWFFLNLILNLSEDAYAVNHLLLINLFLRAHAVVIFLLLNNLFMLAKTCNNVIS